MRTASAARSALVRGRPRRRAFVPDRLAWCKTRQIRDHAPLGSGEFRDHNLRRLPGMRRLSNDRVSAKFSHRTGVKWGHLQENPSRGVDLPKLKTVRPKWALTPQHAAALLQKLPPLGRAMVGLAILSGLRRGELFALRWRDIDEESRVLTVREAGYDTAF